MPVSNPAVPVQTRVHAPAPNAMKSSKNPFKNPVENPVESPVKNTVKTTNSKDNTPTEPRPNNLHIHFDPNSIKSTNVAYVRSVNASIVPGAPPKDTGFYLRPSHGLFSRGSKAPIAAFVPASGKPSTHCLWGTNRAHFDEAVDLYMKHGVVKAMVKNTNPDGEKVKISVVLVGPNDKVPKSLFKIRFWKEPVTWVRAKLLAVKEQYRKACEEVDKQLRKEKEEKEMKKRAEEKTKALESESEDEWDEKVPWE